VNDAELAPFLEHAKFSKVGGIFVALLCFGIASLGFVDDTASLGVQLGLAIPFTIFGLFFLFVIFRSPTKHAAIKLLRNSQDIVWVYVSTQSVNGVHSQTFLNFGNSAGTRKMLAIGKKTDPDPLLARLHTSIPHATYGYSAELEQQYKRQPSSLRRT
jgi:hypothetical protein